MDKYAIAKALFSTPSAQEPGTATVLYGTAAGDSAGGRVSVLLNGVTYASDDDGSAIDMPTTTDVRAGDTVIVTVVDGHPVVTGVVGSGDRLRTDVEAAADAAKSAQQSAASAKESADAATESAKTAQAKAEDATESAATAQSKAEDAGNAAAQAQSDAASAKTAATQAQAQADAATTAATAAQTKADEAATAAATAQSKADTASTAAATAQSKAEDATASANAAGRAAANAQAAAEAAQGDIDSQQAYFWHDSDGSHVLGEKDGYRSDVRADGLHVLSAKDSSELAKFTASGSQLGADNRAHQSMDYHSWRLVDADGNAFAEVLDQRDETGIATVTEDLEWPGFKGAGADTTSFDGNWPLTFVAVAVTKVTVNGAETAEYTLSSDGESVSIPSTAFSKGDSNAATSISASITYTTKSSGVKSYVFGTACKSRYSGAAFGYNTTAYGIDSHAEGNGSAALGGCSHAEGSSGATGANSHSEGWDSIASGRDSHAEGTAAMASGESSHAEGFFTTASGKASHAEGCGGSPFGSTSGYSPKASGDYSHAEGYYASASGKASHAEGYYASASGDFSHASGYHTKAVGDAQTVVGKYNDEDKNAAFIVGNGFGVAPEGSDIKENANAFSVGWDGNVTVQKGLRAASATVSGAIKGGSATLGTPLPVSSGGTGANSAIGARENLFAAELMSGDFNSYNATGVYQSHGSMSNQPVGNWGVLFVLRSVIGNVVRISQVYYADLNNDVFSRTGTGTSLDSITWTGWARLVRSDELDAYARRNGSGLTNAWVGIWNNNTSDPGYRLETCWFVNGMQRGLCVDTYNRLRFYGPGVNNWSLGNLSGDKSMTPIYRLYNQYNSQHLFVSSESEYNNLVSQGWTGEGIKFYAFI